ncbi:MAG: hypothetical protein VXW32_11105 [Myxococcota bacterium]|nr:hypothetical protein [Myxococcota bacterium]
MNDTTREPVPPSDPQGSPRKRAALPILVAVNGLAIAVLAAMANFSDTPAPPPAQTSLLEDLSRMQLGLTADSLSEERREKEAKMITALLPHAERGVADFVSLQVIAAEMRVTGLDWVYLPQKDDVVPVELELKASGSYYNLPILLDGLYRQSRPVEITYLSVETPRAMIAQTDVHLRLRFHRPPSAQTAYLTEIADRISLADDSDTTYLALAEAAKLEQLAAFEREIPRLKEVSKSNRAAIMTTVPGLLRRLPTSALGWVGLELRDGEIVVLNEP